VHRTVPEAGIGSLKMRREISKSLLFGYRCSRDKNLRWSELYQY
jgi:hypothetical protein